MTRRDEIRTAARAFAQRLDAVEHSLDELRGETAAEGEPDFDVEARFSDLLGPLARHVDETAHRVQALEAAVEDVGTQSRAVGEAAESIREELARRATAATAAIDELAARLDEARLPEHSESVEPAELDGLRTEVAHLRAEVTAFAATQHADPTARDQLTTLSARVDALADPTALDDLRRALDALSERPTPIPSSPVGSRSSPHDSTTWRDAASADAELTGRVDELSAIIASLTATVEEVRARPGGDAGLEERVDELDAACTSLRRRARQLPRWRSSSEY